MSELKVGFIAWEPNYGDPRFTAAAQGPAPGSFQTITIGGPRSRERVLAEIEACERTLATLRVELAMQPDPADGDVSK